MARVRTRSTGRALLVRNTERNEVIATLPLPDTAGQWADITAPMDTVPAGKREIAVELIAAAGDVWNWIGSVLFEQKGDLL
ncbi:MAG: hypothetical protein J6K29_02400 [Clostridia bacterium]|nr:hypothetical protein [Clostridia bacterium]